MLGARAVLRVTTPHVYEQAVSPPILAAVRHMISRAAALTAAATALGFLALKHPGSRKRQWLHVQQYFIFIRQK